MPFTNPMANALRDIGGGTVGAGNEIYDNPYAKAQPQQAKGPDLSTLLLMASKAKPSVPESTGSAEIAAAPGAQSTAGLMNAPTVMAGTPADDVFTGMGGGSSGQYSRLSSALKKLKGLF